MADTVRYLMEEMIPELEDFVKQRYFSRDEVQQIVKRRQDFEYLLKRRAALKEDFLRYIEYESKLEALRQQRRQALGAAGRKRSLADYAITRRIHFIFERALRKFRSDVSLWTAWLEFCRASNSHRRLGRVAGRALQVHPTEPGLWVYAAAWEFEQNGNPQAARALMQAGLRLCRHSDKMWLDYFDMELMYVEKLIARRRILGLDVPGEQQEQEQEQDAAAAGSQQQHEQPAAGRKRRRGAAAAASEQEQEQEQQAAAAAGVGGSASEEDGEDGEGPQGDADADAASPAQLILGAQAQQGASEQQEQQSGADSDPQAAVRAVLSGAVARVVFKQALKAGAGAQRGAGALPSANYLTQPSTRSSGGPLALRAGFLRVLARYSSPGAAALRREILDSIRADFSQEPEAADLLARAACDPADAAASEADVQAAVQEYERLLGGRSSSGGAAAAAAAEGSGAKRASKRQKRAAAAAAEREQEQQQEQAQVQLPHDAAVAAYRLYCRFLGERLDALLALQQQQHALAAAAVAQQLFRLMLAAHEAGAAQPELYAQWVELAARLGQRKVALKAARLATDAHPACASAWMTRLDLEAAKVAGGQQLDLLQQALQHVPPAEAVALWQRAFELAAASAATGGSEGASSGASLAALRQQLLAAVTRASTRGPPQGGLGAAAAACLAAEWQAAGPDAARAVWSQLQLLPPAGGDAFRAMVELELQHAAAQAAAQQPAGQDQQQQLPAKALKRVRHLYEAWADAFGGADPQLWVQWAVFEAAHSRAGAGRLYWRAVRALDAPEAFIDAYRARLGGAAAAE